LLDLCRQAEAAGFAGAMCSDHAAPFSARQGSGGFAWSWLGSALAVTNLTWGTVNAPGQRYHPPLIAQAIATLSQMFPRRLWVAFGSGQYINEQWTGMGWPAKAVRNQRLAESVGIIRRLLAGEEVTHDGLVRVREAKLYVRPALQPLLFGAALSPETAQWAAGWADGLITTYQPNGVVQEVIQAFRSGGGMDKPILLQVQHSYAATNYDALQGAHDQWRMSVLPASIMADLPTPQEIDAASAAVRPEDVSVRVRCSSHLADHVGWLREYEALGVEAVYVHNVNRMQREFIAAYGDEVLPKFCNF
jgi:coenzyme F420-dependent glucose-6-phosphate dehydrogenase